MDAGREGKMEPSKYRVIRREFCNRRIVYVVQSLYTFCCRPDEHLWKDVQECETEQLAQEKKNELLSQVIVSETVVGRTVILKKDKICARCGAQVSSDDINTLEHGLDYYCGERCYGLNVLLWGRMT